MHSEYKSRVIKLWNPTYEIFLACKKDGLIGIPADRPDIVSDSEEILFQVEFYKNLDSRSDIITLKSIAEGNFIFINNRGEFGMSDLQSFKIDPVNDFDFLKRVVIDRSDRSVRIQLWHLDLRYRLDCLGPEIRTETGNADSTVFYEVPYML